MRKLLYDYEYSRQQLIQERCYEIEVNEILKERFLEVSRSEIKRDGLEELLGWLEKSDFYYAPASTKYHGSYSGGLLEHKLNVYDALRRIESGFKQFKIPNESIAIVALNHDICKVNYYSQSTRNVKDEKTGQWHKEPVFITNDQMPLGHGEKSVIILQRFMRLTDDEIYAIRWHMGGYDSAVKGGEYAISKAYEICPLAVMLHLADMTATYLMEERSV